MRNGSIPNRSRSWADKLVEDWVRSVRGAHLDDRGYANSF
jgi:hypothetical protein